MKFDINKVICISLKSHNEQQLKAISEVYKLDFKTLVDVKSDLSKIWIEQGGDYAIAFITTDSDVPQIAKRFCPITKKEKDALLNIKPIKTPKMPKSKNLNTDKVSESVELSDVSIDDLINNFDVEEDLDIDVILDKISATGMSSLTKTELDFLNGLSK
jgi:hypothetical protein